MNQETNFTPFIFDNVKTSASETILFSRCFVKIIRNSHSTSVNSALTFTTNRYQNKLLLYNIINAINILSCYVFVLCNFATVKNKLVKLKNWNFLWLSDLSALGESKRVTAAVVFMIFFTSRRLAFLEPHFHKLRLEP